MSNREVRPQPRQAVAVRDADFRLAMLYGAAEPGELIELDGVERQVLAVVGCYRNQRDRGMTLAVLGPEYPDVWDPVDA